MTIEKVDMKDFRPETRWIEVSTGDSVRIIREFNELTLAELAELSGIALSTLANIENDQLKLDMDNAAALAAALNVTAAVLIAQGRETSSKSAA